MTDPTGTPPAAPVDRAALLVVESLLRSATLSMERHDYEGAERALRQGLSRIPEHAGCLAELAICLAQGQRRFITAERLAARAVRVAPRDPSGYFALGRINLLGARKKMAIRYLRKAEALSPYDPRVQSEFQSLGRRRAPVLRSLSRTHPLNVLLGRARAFLSSGSHLALVGTLILVTLISLVTAAYSQTDRDRESAAAGAALTRIDSLLATGLSEQAAREATALLAREASRPDLSWQVEERLGVALQRSGRAREALPHLENAARVVPREPSIHLSLAVTLLALAQRGRAFAEFQEAVVLAPDNWQARLDYGQALAQYRQHDEARRQLEAAAKLCGDCPQASRALASLSLDRGDWAAALPPLERLYAASPAPDVRRELAFCQLRNGAAAAARDLLLPEWPDRLGAEERRLVLEADRALGDTARAGAVVARLGRRLGAGVSAGTTDADSLDAIARDPVSCGLAALILLDAHADREALRASDAAIALDPRTAAYRNNRVVALTRLGRQKDADAEWSRAVALDSTLADKRR